MFIKRGIGKIIKVVDSENLDESQKESVKKALEVKSDEQDLASEGKDKKVN
jgi:hypothetical protein